MEEDMWLATILRAAWFFATLPLVVAWLPLPGIGWLHGALLTFAKSRKILQLNNKLTVPQRTFTHFYAVGIFWTTTLLVAVWLYAITMLPSLIEHDLFSDATSHLHTSFSTREHVYNLWLSVLMLLLMEAQVLRRFYESIYIFSYSPAARMHIIGYIVGVSYYIAAPLSLCCTFVPEVFNFVKNLVAEFIVKGSDPMPMPEFTIWMFVTPFLELRSYTWIGASIFFWGWVHQRRCHEILVMYGGLLVASGGADLSLWLLFAFVVANLGFAATITHAWYLQKFDDYPRKRWAILPFVC